MHSPGEALVAFPRIAIFTRGDMSDMSHFCIRLTFGKINQSLCICVRASTGQLSQRYQALHYVSLSAAIYPISHRLPQPTVKSRGKLLRIYQGCFWMPILHVIQGNVSTQNCSELHPTRPTISGPRPQQIASSHSPQFSLAPSCHRSLSAQVTTTIDGRIEIYINHPLTFMTILHFDLP